LDLAHDGPDIGIVELDEGRLGDGLGDPLDGLGDELVHDREGLPDGEVRHIGEEPVVVKDDDRVGGLRERLEALLGPEEACLLHLEGVGDHAYHDGALVLRDLGDHGC
jgi:hypothetical protein